MGLGWIRYLVGSIYSLRSRFDKFRICEEGAAVFVPRKWRGEIPPRQVDGCVDSACSKVNS